MTSPLRVALRDRLETALRARDKQTVGAMRTVLAALENAEAVEVTASETPVTTSERLAGAVVGLGAGEAPRRLLPANEERALVEREAEALRVASATFAGAGRHERSAELLEAAKTVEAVLES